MALKIRLARGGAKKRPYYSIVVADSRSPRDGRFIEKIGAYNPMLAKDDEKRLTFDVDRAKHWLSVGAKPTDRVARFFSTVGLVEWKRGDNPNKGKPGQNALDRLEANREKAEAASAAPAEEAAAETPAEETPAEEAPAEKATTEEAPAEETPAEEAAADVTSAEEDKSDQETKAE